MRYSLDFVSSVKSYLRNITSLSRQGRVKLFANLDASLRDKGDRLRANAELRVASGSDNFFWDLVIRDTDGDGQIHTFRFVVNDAAAKYGVLRVLDVEEVSR